MIFKQGIPSNGLAGVFRDPSNTEVLPTITRWLIGRYAFREALALLRVWRESSRNYDAESLVHPAVRQEKQSMRVLWLQRMIMPRLVATVMVGHLWIVSQSMLWEILVDFAQSPMIYSLAIGTLLLVFLGFIVVEVYQRAPQNPQLVAAVTPIVWRGLAWSTTLGLVAYALVARLTGASSLVPPLGEEFSFKIVVAESTVALLFGYLVQILWDDKAISDHL